jgi:hypothetical protein
MNVVSLCDYRAKRGDSPHGPEPLDYRSLYRFFDLNRDQIPVRDWLRVNGLLRRLRMGAAATVDDRHFVSELRALVGRPQ